MEFSLPRQEWRFVPSKLRAHTDRLGLKPAELAVLVGVSRPTVDGWLAGKWEPKGGALIALGDLFKIDPRELGEYRSKQ